MSAIQELGPRRFSGDAGIAIGPILFIIAILGILAAAIAAGSGSFTSGTSTESNGTKASALIQIGENLKVGYDRIAMTGDVTVNNVVANVNNTSTTADLFSPTGGGITIPSNSLAADAANNIWVYPWAELPQAGTGDKERLAMLKVTAGVCDVINQKANGFAAAANVQGDLGAAITNATNDLGDLTSDWPDLLKGKMLGCVENTHGNATDYYFYQVLAVQ